MKKNKTARPESVPTNTDMPQSHFFYFLIRVDVKNSTKKLEVGLVS